MSKSRISLGLNVIVQNKKLVIGLCMLIGMYLFVQIGSIVWPYHPKKTGDVRPNLPPSQAHPLGSDILGRDILAQLFHGTVNSLYIGIVAGVLSFTMATLLGLTAAYFGGILDTVISLVAEVFYTIPSLAILIIIAAVYGSVSLEFMILILAAFGWAFPTKVLRSQALSLRERAFVRFSRLSGSSGIEIVLKEIMPNMLPFLGTWFAFSVGGAMLSEAALELIGLGPQTITTLGLMLNWAMNSAAFIRGLVYWWFPPSVVLVWIFLSLFIVSLGLDEISNPRLR